MTFVSLEFLLLFIVTSVIYRLLKENRTKQILLLTVSFIFYAYWDIRFLALLLFQLFVSYKAALIINKNKDFRKRKITRNIAIVVSLGILFFFKYFNFFVDSIGIKTLNIILPVGISFYTFQAISYVVDVYRGKLEARDDFVKVALYIAFFPQLVAGPIVRASDFLPQLDEEKFIKKDNIEFAICVFLFGLAKKVVIADRLSLCVDELFKNYQIYSAPSIVLAVIAYSIQIYCDFSGYSDMAIAVAKFFGYDLCINFNLPYASKNPTEFWKRWHISLSSWLQDYLYIPLGGNRKGKIRTYINLMITMLLGGLWHGANWTFIIWGGLHGLALAVHKMFRKKIGNSESKIITYVSIVATYVWVCFCWIFFRADSIETAFGIIKRIACWSSGVNYIYVYAVAYGLIIFCIQLLLLANNKGNGKYMILDLSKFSSKLVISFSGFLIIILAYYGNTPFVYFQF